VAVGSHTSSGWSWPEFSAAEEKLGMALGAMAALSPEWAISKQIKALQPNFFTET